MAEQQNDQAPDEGGQQQDEVLEPHLWQEGMNPGQAQGLLEELLSDDPEFADGEGTAEETRSTDTGDSTPESKAEDEVEDESDDPAEWYDEWDEEDEIEDFGGEDDEYEESGEVEDEEPELYTVKVDGQEHEVTLDELLSGYSFRRHNTQRSQELAAERKELEAEVATVREDRQKYRERLEALEKALAEVSPQEPDWERLKQENPQQYLLVRDEWNQLQAQRQALADEQQAEAQREYDEAVKAFEAQKGVEADKLIEAIPAWTDHDKARKELAAIKRAAIQHYGYTEEELRPLIDSRAILVLRDAVRHRRIRAKGKETVEGKRKKKSGTPLKPGAKKPRSTKRAKAARRHQTNRRRLAESGSMTDASRAIFDILSDQGDF